MKKITFTFLAIIVICCLVSCKNDEEKSADPEFDLEWKSEMQENTLILDIDGNKFVLDSCLYEPHCGQVALTAQNKEGDTILFLLWDPFYSKPNTGLSYIEYKNSRDTLDMGIHNTGMISTKGYKQVMDWVNDDNDSIFTKAVFHIKVSDNKKVKNIKGQFYMNDRIGKNRYYCN